MKRLLPVIAFAVLAAPAFASEQLAKEKNCLTCHGVANKIIGPSYKDIAAKYAGQKDAADKLAAKIKGGGKGVWGEVPMPANNVTDAEAKTLATWVLSVK